MIPLSQVWRDRLIRLLNKLDIVWCPKCGHRIQVKATPRKERAS